MSAVLTDATILELALPGAFRDVNPRTFSFPPVRAEVAKLPYGCFIRIAANVEGIPEPIYLFDSIDARLDEAEEAAAAFNLDPVTSWSALLPDFVDSERRRLAASIEEFGAEERFILTLERELVR